MVGTMSRLATQSVEVLNNVDGRWNVVIGGHLVPFGGNHETPRHGALLAFLVALGHALWRGVAVFWRIVAADWR